MDAAGVSRACDRALATRGTTTGWQTWQPRRSRPARRTNAICSSAFAKSIAAAYRARTFFRMTCFCRKPSEMWRSSVFLRNSMAISQMSGVHLSIPQLPRMAPLRTVKNYDDFLTRLEAYPRQVDQIIELLKRGIAAGWVPPEIALAKVPPQIAKQFAQDVKQSPLYKPFESFPEAIGPAERVRLEARALETIKGSIVPALKRLHQFITETYLHGAGRTSPRRSCRTDQPTIRHRSGSTRQPTFRHVRFMRSGSRK